LLKKDKTALVVILNPESAIPNLFRKSPEMLKQVQHDIIQTIVQGARRNFFSKLNQVGVIGG